MSSSDKPLILLTEDDEAIAFLVKTQLQDCAHVEVAYQYEEALSKAANKLYDGFLIDINLGFGKTGVDLLKSLRELPHYSNAPMATLTAYSMTGDREKFLKEGFDFYISKPFSSTELRLLITHMVPGTCN